MTILRRLWSFIILTILLVLLSITGILASILWPIIQWVLLILTLIFDKRMMKADVRFVIPNKADFKQYRENLADILEGLTIYK
jgi:hypothetical protein